MNVYLLVTNLFNTATSPVCTAPRVRRMTMATWPPPIPDEHPEPGDRAELPRPVRDESGQPLQSRCTPDDPPGCALRFLITQHESRCPSTLVPAQPRSFQCSWWPHGLQARDWNSAHGRSPAPKPAATAGTAKAAACSPATYTTEIDLNNVRALLTTGGLLWYDKAQGNPAYEVPKTDDRSGANAIFAGGLWMGGLSPDNQLKLAAVRYRDRQRLLARSTDHHG